MKGSAAAAQLRRSTAGAAAHLRVWRPGRRGGRASRRAARGRGHRGGGGSGGRSCRQRPRRTGLGRRGLRRAVCSRLPRDPVTRRQTDRPQRPRPPPHPPPALLSNDRTPSLSPDFFFPWCSQRRKKIIYICIYIYIIIFLSCRTKGC